MTRYVLTAVMGALMTLTGAARAVAASDRINAESLERLRGEIAKRLPDGWSVSLEVARQPAPHSDDESPALVIVSKDKLAIETVFPGSAPGQEPYRETKPVEIVLAVRPHLTVEQYAKVAANNGEFIKAREAAEGKLREIPWAYKGAAPVPPSAFRPRNDDERRQVLEYALLWNCTAPSSLPTHYFERLAFERTLPFESSNIVDKSKNEQYRGILKALDEMLKPYEPARQAAK